MQDESDLALAVPMFIKERRQAKKWTQERLAQEAGISTTMVHNLEKGKNGFTDKMLAALAKALSCQPADLLLPLNWSGARIRTESEIHAMLARIEGLSQTDIDVARAVILNSLRAKQDGQGQSDARDQRQGSTPRREEEPSR